MVSNNDIRYTGEDGVVLLVKADTRRLQYCYAPGSEVDFACDLLSEVGEPWQPAFRRLLAQHGIVPVLHDGDDGFYEVVSEG